MLLPSDDVHTLLAMEMLGGVRDAGLALDPTGQGSVQVFPAMMFSTQTLMGMPTLLFPAGSSVVGIHLTVVLLNALLVLAGWCLVSPAFRPSRVVP
ncbi:MAG: hypothetical protein AAB289_06225, partial [Chloroflexota bacterium]